MRFLLPLPVASLVLLLAAGLAFVQRKAAEFKARRDALMAAAP
jgi:hypothetical protein